MLILEAASPRKGRSSPNGSFGSTAVDRGRSRD